MTASASSDYNQVPAEHQGGEELKLLSARISSEAESSKSAEHDHKHPQEEPFELCEDVYDFFIFRLAEFWSRDGIPDSAPRLHLFHGALLYVTNLFVQGFVIYYVNIAANVEEAKWHDHSWTASFGMTLRGSVTASEHKGLLAKCALQNQVPDVLLYYIMIFIWAVSQTKEFKRIRDWMRTIWSVRPLSLDRPYPMTEDKIIIHALSPCMKVIVFLANPLARSLLFIPVTFVGAKFLALQTVPFALVMKAVALQLVLNFDEMMVASLALRKAVAQLTRARFMTPCHERTCIPYWYDGVGSMFFYIMIVLFVVGFLEGYYADLMYLEGVAIYTMTISGNSWMESPGYSAAWKNPDAIDIVVVIVVVV
eukprot:CAMPEP_0115148670 /NCGR_PEP_ID=MMETSP0227-20121206/64010_1 /TAXON_ID=89957 /ORGANISM="Polarella glacialis, Strain CCMP 1383" /LENGTH=365 /DNA_ID=CAMNT_0002558745 /DNA_START=31 /DNA_END=1126 /DNA_ORIENTATION=-